MDNKKIDAGQNGHPKIVINWVSCLYYILVHVFAIFGLFSIPSAKLYTTLLAFCLYICGTLGTTAGSHRLWSHKSYKARTPLKILLLIFNTIAFQHSAYQWARDHRVHHKYSDTNADPYNINRGFFFAHIGWLMCKKHPDVGIKGKGIDMSDIESDKILMWQKKYYFILAFFACYFTPTVAPMYLWGESFKYAFYLNLLRYCWAMHVILFINSTGHWNGIRPYDRSIRPVENFPVSIINLGECWHNFHHAFPWDYKAGEFAGYSTNFSASFIELMAKIGWAYDLKFASNEMIKKRIERSGDGTHGVFTPKNVNNNEPTVPVLTKWI